MVIVFKIFQTPAQRNLPVLVIINFLDFISFYSAISWTKFIKFSSRHALISCNALYWDLKRASCSLAVKFQFTDVKTAFTMYGRPNLNITILRYSYHYTNFGVPSPFRNPISTPDDPGLISQGYTKCVYVGTYSQAQSMNWQAYHPRYKLCNASFKNIYVNVDTSQLGVLSFRNLFYAPLVIHSSSYLFFHWNVSIVEHVQNPMIFFCSD